MDLFTLRTAAALNEPTAMLSNVSWNIWHTSFVNGLPCRGASERCRAIKMRFARDANNAGSQLPAEKNKTHNDRQPVTPKVGAGTNAKHRKVSGSEMGMDVHGSEMGKFR